jgi:hypothetical protein
MSGTLDKSPWPLVMMLEEKSVIPARLDEIDAIRCCPAESDSSVRSSSFLCRNCELVRPARPDSEGWSGRLVVTEMVVLQSFVERRAADAEELGGARTIPFRLRQGHV